MKAEEILESFLKYANLNSTALQPSEGQKNLIQAPIISGQPPQRVPNIANDSAGAKSGNTVSIKPLTNNKKLTVK
jgi:hypothetical protein